MNTAAELFAFLAAHPQIIEVARQAVECGCTEETIVKAIEAASDAALKAASDAEMKNELP